MTRTLLILLVSLTVFMAIVPSFADSPSLSPRVKLMQERLARREAAVNGWSRQAEQQLYLSIAVGLLGLIVALLQGPSKKWTKWLAVTLGFLISAMTLLSNRIYPAAYKTLLRSVEEAKPILEELEGTVEEFDPTQSIQNQKDIEDDFKAKCGKIDIIGEKILGVEPEPQKTTNGSSIFNSTGVVFAQAKPQAPAWTLTKIQNDKSSTFFVGFANDKSLAAARDASYKNATTVGAHWLKDNQVTDNQAAPPPQLLELVRRAAEISDTWYSYDRATGLYLYYTRLRLTNEFHPGSEEYPPADHTAQASRSPVTVTLANDSANQIAETGLILLIKHMGFAPLTADLYVLTGKVGDSDAVHPYTHNRGLAEKYVARFRSSLPSCNGGHALIDGYTVWCFRVEESKIKQKSHKSQHLGIVTDDSGGKFDLFAVKLDYQAPSIQVELRAAM